MSTTRLSIPPTPHPPSTDPHPQEQFKTSKKVSPEDIKNEIDEMDEQLQELGGEVRVRAMVRVIRLGLHPTLTIHRPPSTVHYL